MWIVGTNRTDIRVTPAAPSPSNEIRRVYTCKYSIHVPSKSYLRHNELAYKCAAIRACVHCVHSRQHCIAWSCAIPSNWRPHSIMHPIQTILCENTSKTTHNIVNLWFSQDIYNVLPLRRRPKCSDFTLVDNILQSIRVYDYYRCIAYTAHTHKQQNYIICAHAGGSNI